MTAALSFGERLRRWRQFLSLNQDDCAWLLGCHRVTYARAEANRAELPTPSRQLARDLLALADEAVYQSAIRALQYPYRPSTLHAGIFERTSRLLSLAQLAYPMLK